MNNNISVRPQFPLETPILLVMPTASRGSVGVILTVTPAVQYHYNIFLEHIIALHFFVALWFLNPISI